MSPPLPFQSKLSAGTAAKSVSWLALVAATTIGLGEVDSVRAEIAPDPSGEDLAARGRTRLIVQSYRLKDLDARGLPRKQAQPVGSLQRAVTSEQLAAGLSVDVLSVGGEPPTTEHLAVFAWTEDGDPDLEFDARQARPDERSYFGIAHGGVATRSVSLQRR